MRDCRMRGTRSVARAYARMGDDRQAVRWLEQAIRLGVRPADLLGDESFRRYRDTPRLRGDLRRQVGPRRDTSSRQGRRVDMTQARHSTRRLTD
jgi:hypothetical protein